MKPATWEAARSSNCGSSWDSPGRGPPWECRAARGHQVRPEEVQEPSWGTSRGGTLTVLSGLFRLLEAPQLPDLELQLPLRLERARGCTLS